MRSTNIIYGVLVLIGIAVAAVLYRDPNDPGKLGAAAFTFLTFMICVAWVIQLFIEHRAAKQAPKALTPDEQARYRRNRILVVIGLILFILSPFIIDHLG